MRVQGTRASRFRITRIQFRVRIFFHTPQQLGSFFAETDQFFVCHLVFVHPLDGHIVLTIGLFTLAQLPMRHGHEHGVEAHEGIAETPIGPLQCAE